MRLNILSISALLLTATTRTLALGINCRGSSLCGQENSNATVLAHLIDTIDGEIWAEDGQQIACQYENCAFFQKTGVGDYISTAKRLAWEIVDHGCRTCGSCPTGYPEDNDVKYGELTFNYVLRPCGEEGNRVTVCPDFMDASSRERLEEKEKWDEQVKQWQEEGNPDHQ